MAQLTLASVTTGWCLGLVPSPSDLRSRYMWFRLRGRFGGCGSQDEVICYHGLVFGSAAVILGPMKHTYVDLTVMGRFGGCGSQEEVMSMRHLAAPAPNGPVCACICYHGLVFGSGAVILGPMKRIYEVSTVMGRFGGCGSQELKLCPCGILPQAPNDPVGA